MFQPAEELLAGAAAMVEDGILENPKVDVALGLHISVGMDDTRSGIIRYIPGVANNSGDAIRISIQGHGVHGSKALFGRGRHQYRRPTPSSPSRRSWRWKFPVPSRLWCW